MKKAVASIFLVCFVCATFLLAFVVRGNDLLLQADQAFFPVEVGYFKALLEDYENNKYRRYYLVEVFTRDDNYLLVGLEPSVMKGAVQLRVGDIIYSYLKRIDRMEQVSARTAFQRSVLSQEDIMTTSLSKFYELTGCEKDSMDGREIYILHLKARSRDVAYYRIVSYIEADSYELIKRDYFTVSGDKIREMVVEEIQREDRRHKLLRFTFYDTLRPGYYTKVKIYDFDYDMQVPETYFTRSYMKAVAR